MKANLVQFVLPVLASTSPALASPPSLGAVAEPVPIGSPADWLDPGAYPSAALRYEMAGATAFKLTVDAEGKPNRCYIAESSGFDVLDKATCERLLVKARFSPARGDRGKLGERTYSGRVRWVIPEDAASTVPTSDHFGRVLLTLDAAGKVSSCRMVSEVPALPEQPSDPRCKELADSIPPSVASALLEKSAGAPVEAEMQSAIAFTPELRARVLAPKPGYEQLALNVYRFTVTKEGTLGKCAFVEQRGLESMIADSCRAMLSDKFDPPFSALDKDGIATGWRIVRALVKTGR